MNEPTTPSAPVTLIPTKRVEGRTVIDTQSAPPIGSRVVDDFTDLRA